MTGLRLPTYTVGSRNVRFSKQNPKTHSIGARIITAKPKKRGKLRVSLVEQNDDYERCIVGELGGYRRRHFKGSVQLLNPVEPRMIFLMLPATIIVLSSIYALSISTM